MFIVSLVFNSIKLGVPVIELIFIVEQKYNLSITVHTLCLQTANFCVGHVNKIMLKQTTFLQLQHSFQNDRGQR